MSVALVGAGPGDGGLLTLKGAKRLKAADVVLYDRIVGDEIIGMIPDGAERVDVGKNAGSHPVPQEEINRLLLEYASRGLNVVRLKGGDPFVFGRGGEELELLAENGIPFEVVPGVTSAVAGAAYAGIPVTHRDYASSLHFITAHAKNHERPCINYRALVQAGGTLVFLMGVSAIADIAAGCMGAGMEGSTPAAVVENATTGAQRKFIATVGTLAETARQNGVKSPALIIVGGVCGLSPRYDWFGKKPLLGRRIAVARAGGGASALADGLRELGCAVTEIPCFETVPIDELAAALERPLKDIARYSWLVFTSATGVDVFFGHLIETGFDVRGLAGLKIACVGGGTAKALRGRGLTADFVPEEYSGAALARGLAPLAKGGRALIARAKDGAEGLAEGLAAGGAAFDDIAIYERRADARGAASAAGAGGFDFAAFTSSSAADGFAKAAPGADFAGINAVCIGGRTAATARAYGMKVFLSKEATVGGMIDRIKELCE